MGLIETYVNLSQYNDFEIKAYPLQRGEALECVQALERRIPKKVILQADGEKTMSGLCPSCGKEITFIKKSPLLRMMNFCGGCGQRINWEK